MSAAKLLQPSDDSNGTKPNTSPANYKRLYESLPSSEHGPLASANLTTYAQPFPVVFDSLQSTPILWFIISLLVWGLVALLVWRVFKKMHFRSQGLTTIRTRFYRKVQ